MFTTLEFFVIEAQFMVTSLVWAGFCFVYQQSILKQVFAAPELCYSSIIHGYFSGLSQERDKKKTSISE